MQILLLSSGTSSSASSTTGSVKGAGAFFPGGSGGEIEGIDEVGRIHISGNSAGAGAIQGKPVQRKGAWRDVWLGGGVMGEALSGFVLGWAGVGGVLR